MLIDLIKIICSVFGTLIGAYILGRMFGAGFFKSFYDYKVMYHEKECKDTK